MRLPLPLHPTFLTTLIDLIIVCRFLMQLGVEVKNGGESLNSVFEVVRVLGMFFPTTPAETTCNFGLILIKFGMDIRN